MNKRKRRIKSGLDYWMFVGPAFLFFILIVIIPFFIGIYYSFTNWNGVDSTVLWVGFDNFIKLFTSDTAFLNSFWFTLRFTVTVLILTNVVGFIFALLVTNHLKTQNMLRTAFFIPNVIGGLILGFIWQFIFVRGFASIGEIIPLPFFQAPWLGDPRTAFWAMVIVFVWQLSGYMMIIYIAALQGVDESLLEAARIDGANAWQQLFKVVIPLIVPAFTICLFLTTSMAFKVFDLNFALTGGGPFNSTESLTIHIFEQAFSFNNYGLGSAKALVFFIIVALITLLQVNFTKRREVNM
ncbi:carbohydrate ABC transporter permease [Radiobacillus sp. PE A8.2]|uniref:carbohydrate ABC transporter permease n=1 Tax=Radiobacillus sp. PE A8.2 TaxID=3380349 RepID=UPI00388DA00F